MSEAVTRIGLWLCRHGFHALREPGNCTRCGYRYHGGHVGTYARWERERRVGRSPS